MARTWRCKPSTPGLPCSTASLAVALAIALLALLYALTRAPSADVSLLLSRWTVTVMALVVCLVRLSVTPWIASATLLVALVMATPSTVSAAFCAVCVSLKCCEAAVGS